MSAPQLDERACTPLVAMNRSTRPREEGPSLAEHGLEGRGLLHVLIRASPWRLGFLGEGVEA